MSQAGSCMRIVLASQERGYFLAQQYLESFAPYEPRCFGSWREPDVYNSDITLKNQNSILERHIAPNGARSNAGLLKAINVPTELKTIPKTSTGMG